MGDVKWMYWPRLSTIFVFFWGRSRSLEADFRFHMGGFPLEWCNDRLYPADYIEVCLRGANLSFEKTFVDE